MIIVNLQKLGVLLIEILLYLMYENLFTISLFTRLYALFSHNKPT